MKALRALAWESLTPALCTRQAAFNGFDEVVAVLLKLGARADIADRDGKTPLQCAIEQHHLSVIILLRAEANS